MAAGTERRSGLQGFHGWRADRLVETLRAGTVGRAALALYGLIFVISFGWDAASAASGFASEGPLALFKDGLTWIWWGVFASCWWTLRKSGRTGAEQAVALHTPAVVWLLITCFGGASIVFFPLVLAFELAGSGLQIVLIAAPFVLVGGALMIAAYLLPLLWMRSAARQLAVRSAKPFRYYGLWRRSGALALVLLVAGPLFFIGNVWRVERRWQAAQRAFETEIGPLDSAAYDGTKSGDGATENATVDDALLLSDDEYVFLRETLKDPTWRDSALHRERVRTLVARNEELIDPVLARPPNWLTASILDLSSPNQGFVRVRTLLHARLEAAALDGTTQDWQRSLVAYLRLAEIFEEAPGSLALSVGTRAEIFGLSRLRGALAERRVEGFPREGLPTVDLDDALGSAMAWESLSWIDVYRDNGEAPYLALPPGIERYMGKVYWRWFTQSTATGYLEHSLAWYRALRRPYAEVRQEDPPAPSGSYLSRIFTANENLERLACRAQGTVSIRQLAQIALDLAEDTTDARARVLQDAIAEGAGPRFLPFADEPIRVEGTPETGLIVSVEGLDEAFLDCKFFFPDDATEIPLRWEIPPTPR